MDTCLVCCEDMCGQGISRGGLDSPGMMEALIFLWIHWCWLLWCYSWYPQWCNSDGARRWYPRWWCSSRSQCEERSWQYFLLGFYRVQFIIPNWARDAESGLMRVSIKSFTAWRAASVEEIFGTGQSWGENSTILVILSSHVAGKYTV